MTEKEKKSATKKKDKKKWEKPTLTVKKIESPPLWASCSSGSDNSGV